MSEIEQDASSEVSLFDVADFIIRWRWLYAVVIVACAGLAVPLKMVLPASYTIDLTASAYPAIPGYPNKAADSELNDRLRSNIADLETTKSGWTVKVHSQDEADKTIARIHLVISDYIDRLKKDIATADEKLEQEYKSNPRNSAVFAALSGYRIFMEKANYVHLVSYDIETSGFELSWWGALILGAFLGIALTTAAIFARIFFAQWQAHRLDLVARRAIPVSLEHHQVGKDISSIFGPSP